MFKLSSTISTRGFSISISYPFGSEVNFEFKSGITGHATLELFDVLGHKLAVVYSGDVNAQVPYSVSYKVPAGYKVSMIYKLAIGKEVLHGILLPEK